MHTQFVFVMMTVQATQQRYFSIQSAVFSECRSKNFGWHTVGSFTKSAVIGIFSTVHYKNRRIMISGLKTNAFVGVKYVSALNYKLSNSHSLYIIYTSNKR
jgi:hypothetical protein